jgi:hypothetical protein
MSTLPSVPSNPQHIQCRYKRNARSIAFLYLLHVLTPQSISLKYKLDHYQCPSHLISLQHIANIAVHVTREVVLISLPHFFLSHIFSRYLVKLYFQLHWTPCTMCTIKEGTTSVDCVPWEKQSYAQDRAAVLNNLISNSCVSFLIKSGCAPTTRLGLRPCTKLEP